MIDPYSSALIPSNARSEIPILNAAKDLEKSFLAEMLKSAGLGSSQGTFSGGIGEEQFASFLVAEQANTMTEAGGIGLAEHIFKSIVEKSDEN